MLMTIAGARRVALMLVAELDRVESRAAMACELFGLLQHTVGFDTGIVQSLEGAPPLTVHKGERQQRLWNVGAQGYMRDLQPFDHAGKLAADVVHDREVFSMRERDRLQVYVEYLRPLGAISNLAILARERGCVRQLIGIARYRTARPFRARELEIVRALQPALSVAVRLFPGTGVEPDVAIARATGGATRRLSPREREVVGLVCRGLRNAEIAAVCGTSANTVRNQIAAIFRKLEVSTRTELVGLAASAGIGSA